MAREIRNFAVSVPASTPIASPQVTALTMPARIVRRVRIDALSSGPFGRYAAPVAAAAALLILAAWVATAIHLGGTPENAGLNAAALLVLGAIFGTAAGASAIANGVGKSADAANTRLDAIAA